jgi:hypothetical protein
MFSVFSVPVARKQLSEYLHNAALGYHLSRVHFGAAPPVRISARCTWLVVCSAMVVAVVLCMVVPLGVSCILAISSSSSSPVLSGVHVFQALYKETNRCKR